MLKAELGVILWKELSDKLNKLINKLDNKLYTKPAQQRNKPQTEAVIFSNQKPDKSKQDAWLTTLIFRFPPGYPELWNAPPV